MKRRRVQLLPWLFTLVTLASLSLCVLVVCDRYLAIDSDRIETVGHFEVRAHSSNWVTVHVISAEEQAWRQKVEDRATLESRFEHLRDPIDRDLQTRPWGSQEYRQALARYDNWWVAHKSFLKTFPSVPAKRFSHGDTAIPLWRLPAMQIVLPVLWLFLWWLRWRDSLPRLLRRLFNWLPPHRLNWFQRSRRVAFAGVSMLSLILLFATAGQWVRSHYVCDSYSTTQAAVVGVNRGFDRRFFYTFGNGFSFGRLHLAGVLPRPQPPIVQAQFNSFYMQLFNEAQNSRMHGASLWHRDTPRLSPSGAWLGVGVTPSSKFPNVTGITIQIRWWVGIVVFGLLPVVWVITHLRRWALPEKGYCISCGYNLAGNLSGICPECGEPI